MLISSILYIHGVGRFLQVVLYPFQPFFKKPLDADNNDIKPRVMEKYTNEELLDVLPSGVKETKELTNKQKVVLGQLCVYNGLDIAKRDGFFYRSNKDLCDDCDISEHTLISAIRKLEMLGFIDRGKGSRSTGASEYRINEKLIGDYCKTNTANCSEDCSKQIVEMADRIRELEITVKLLVKKIAVMETANCSTDTDTEKELEKEKEINNNILEETVSCKEPKEEKSDENLTEYQASSPIEEQSQASSVEVSTVTEPSEEESQIPTEDEQYQQWLQVLTPCLNELEGAKTLDQFRNIKERLSQIGSDYLDNHENTSPTVVERMNKTVGSALKTKKEELTPHVMELSDYLSRQHNYASL